MMEDYPATLLPAILLTDFYKVSHASQMPTGTEQVYSTWIPRSTRIEGIDHVVAFGFQAFIQHYLVEYFDTTFFDRPEDEVIAEYERVIRYTLGVDKPASGHIRDLHRLGYLPLRIRAVPEGTRVPLRVPMLTVENTRPDQYWLTNYLETLFSCEVWQPSTSATLAYTFRQLLNSYAVETTGSIAGVEFQGHDFSMRGMGGLEPAAKSGMGHLLSFVGTDTIPAIIAAEKYYGANIEEEMVGTSIAATEHSVMCAYGQDELASYRRLITEIYPSGMLSIVSDTWDLWSVLTDTLPALKDEIMNRDGRIVIRPDSGDPVKIICGDPDSEDHDAHRGVIEILWDTFGGSISEQGYKILDPHIGAIYGDAINLERCEQICANLKAKGFASTNIVFGIGSYNYQYQTRDTFGFALKSTYVQISGEGRNIFKDPKTGDGSKKSLTGRVVVRRDDIGMLYVSDGLSIEQQDELADVDLLQDLYLDGKMVRYTSFAEVRSELGLIG